MATFLDRPQASPVRRALFQVHLWLGVLAGAYIFVVCVTGAALVFRIDLQRAVHPDLFTPGAPGVPADPVDVMHSVEAAFPGERLAGVDAPTTVRPTYLAYTSSADRVRTLLLDPVSAELLGELPEQSIVGTLQDLHFDLLAGRAGRVANGIGAGLLLGLCLTGIVIWWPGRSRWWRGLVVDPRRSWKRVTWEAHSAIGFWAALFVAMWAVTGVYFAFPAQFRAVVNRVSPVTTVREPRSSPVDARTTTMSWQELVGEARRHAPEQHVARVVVPATETSPFLVLFTPVRPTPAGTAELTSVYLDQYTGDLLAMPPVERSFGDTVMAWVGPLHVGSFGGRGVRIAWLVVGLAPPALFATGFLMWWARVVRPRRLRVPGAEVVEA